MRSKIVFFVSICAFIGLFFAACNVGLGEAVDTQPPVVEISYPPVDSVIREVFEMNGTCSDETSLASINLKFQDINDSSNTYTKSASFNALRTKWHCTLNAKNADGSFPIRDGSYEITVTATDSAGRQTSKSRTLKIDNTAPVLVLQNPSSTVAVESINTFGKSFKIVGSLSDDNSIDNLTFDAFNYETGEAIASTSVNSVPQSMSLVIGSYSKAGDDDYDASDFYQQIFKGNSDSKENYKFKISVSDCARIFDNKARASERGNICWGYYLEDDIYSSILNKITYKELYTLFKETDIRPEQLISEADAEVLAEKMGKLKTQLAADKPTLSSSEISTVVTAIYEKFICTSEESDLRGTFALRPDNSPSWSGLGLNVWEIDNWGNYTYQPEGSLAIQYAVGLGNTPLDTDSFALKLVYVDDQGVARTEKVGEYPLEVVLFESVPALTEKYKDDETALNAALAARNALFSKNSNVWIDVSNKQISFGLSCSAELNTSSGYYEVVLTGQDQDGNSFNNNGNRYMFMYARSTTIPVLDVTSPSENSIYVSGIKKADNSYEPIVFTGSAESGSSSTLKLAAEVMLKNVADGEDANFVITDTPGYYNLVLSNDDKGENSRKYDFTLTLYPEKFLSKSKSDSYDLTVKVSDGNGFNDKETYQLYYDVETPVISMDISNLIVTYKADGETVLKDNNVNGVITVKLDYNDDDVFNTGNFYAVAGGKYFHVYYKDGASEVVVRKETELNSLSKFKTFYINTKKAYTRTENAGNVTYTQVEDANVPDNCELAITAETVDRSGNLCTTTEKVYINQETDKPGVSFSNMEKDAVNLFGMGSNILYGTASDDDKISSVTCYIDYVSDANYFSKTVYSNVNSSTKSFQIDLTKIKNGNADSSSTPEKVMTAGGHTLKVIVADVDGNKNDLYTINFAYDTDLPSFESSKIDDEDYVSEMWAKASFTVSGTVSDASGISAVYWYNSSTSKYDTSTNLIAAENVGKFLSSTDWSFSATHSDTTGDSTTGDKFKVVDKFGRESEFEIKVKVDTKKPVFDSSKIKISGTTASGSVSYTIAAYNALAVKPWFTNSVVTFEGGDKNDASSVPVKEDHMDSITVSYNATTGSIKTTGTSNRFTSSLPMNDAAAAVVSFVAQDLAGNVSTTLSVVLNVDTKAPSAPAVGLYSTSENATNGQNAFAANTITNKNTLFFKYSTVEETSGIKQVDIYQDSTFDSEKFIKSFTTAEISGVLEVPLKLNGAASNMEDSSYTLALRVTDNAGNTSFSNAVKFIRDTTAPEISFTSPAENTSLNKKITLSGKLTEANASPASWNAKLYYKQASGDSWALATTKDSGATITVDSQKKWSCKVDTSKFEDNKNIWFMVEAVDKAGNSSKDKNSIKYEISEDGDRPVITLSGLNTDADNPTTLSTGIIKGSIADDDGLTGLKLYVQVVNLSSIPAGSYKEKLPSESGNAWELVTVDESGNWTYEVASGDGNYKLYFYVEDAGTPSTAFYKSSTDTSIKYAKVVYSDKAAVSDGISFSIDVQPPNIDAFEYATPLTNKATTEDDDYQTAGFNAVVGGPNKPYVQFRVKASDTVLTDASKLTIKLSFLDSDAAETLTYNDDGYFYSKVVAVGSASGVSGQYYAMVNAYDNSATPKIQTVNFVVDNSKPTGISNVTPSSQEEITGDINLSGMCSDETVANSGVVAIYYVIPYKGTLNASSVNEVSGGASAIASSRWTLVSPDGNTDSLTSWKVSVEAPVTGTSAILPQYASHTSVSEIYTLPVWFKLVDKAGNVGYVETSKIRYNPNADKPIVSINYPDMSGSEAKTGKNSSGASFNYVVLGGNIRISGIATDNESVGSVYLQFDMNGDGIWDNGYPDASTKKYSSTATKIDGVPFAVSEIKAIPCKSGEYGIPVTGTASWYYTLKVSDLGTGLLYDDKTGGNKKVLGVRAIAVDNGNDDEHTGQLAGNFSEPVYISVNNGIPAFETAEIRWYSSASEAAKADGVAEKSKEYESGMYISGSKWYLCVPVTSTAKFNATTPFDYSFTKGTTVDSDVIVIASDGATNERRELRIPVKSETSWAVEVTANDTSSKYNRASYSMNVDSISPAFPDADIYKSGATETGEVILYSNYYGTKGNPINSKETRFSKLADNDGGSFKLLGKVSDAGSGVDMAFVYFERKGSTNRIYNPLVTYNKSNYSAGNNLSSRIDITNSTTTAANGKIYINSEKLPALYISSATRETVYKIQSDLLKNDVNIGTAGYVKIGGVYRKIKEFDKATGTITMETSCATSYKSVEVIYAIAIDKHEGSADSDGDGVVEELSASGISCTFAATLTTKNMPDGAVEVHVVSFDVAGNSCHYYAASEISNSAPRITRVRLGTDLNQNNSYEESEFETFYAISNKSRSEGKEIWNLDTTNAASEELYKVKKGLAVIPEFVGGNTNENTSANTTGFLYKFSKNTTSGITAPETATSAIKIKDSAVLGETSDFGFASGNNGGVFVLSNSDLGTASDDKDFVYRFSFWDSTEETTPGTDSQWTILNATVNQHVVDKTAPTAVIKPFYWKSSTDNSLYENSTANGHIELEGDWSNSAKKSGTTGQYDGDPKVSGKIVITGSAFDETCLSKLTMQIDNFKLTSTAGAVCNIATYSTSTASWTIANGPSSNTAGGVLATDGWHFEITNTDKTPTQAGHTINWKLEMDTSFVTGTAAADIRVVTTAYDTSTNKTGGNNSTPGTTNTTAASPKGYYRMDVVPYIRKVSTSLDILNKNNASVFNRTANGHYPVYVSSTYTGTSNNSDLAATVMSETISITGFNMTGAKYGATDLSVTGNVVSFDVSNMTESGKLDLTVNGISTLNNYNDNDGKGDYAGVSESEYYNRLPNNVNNNNLTDDVYIDVWDINTTAARPVSGAVEQPVMKINPVNGMLGFAFANGPLYFSMPSGSEAATGWYNWTSHDFYEASFDFFTSIGMAYDSKGWSYGCAAGGDINASSADNFFLMSSRWGTGGKGQYGSYDGTKKIRLEKIGQTGTPNVFNKQRIQSPSIGTAVHGDYTDVYMVYYDDINGEIRFRSGQTSASQNDNFGNFVDHKNGRDKVIAYNTTSGNSNLIAGGSSASRDTGYNPGEYVSLAVISDEGATTYDDVVVIVWYDNEEHKLMYTYNEDVKNKKEFTYRSGMYSYDSESTDYNGFAEPTEVFPGTTFIGEYCKVAVDKAGHIHVAAYDSLNADVIYGYAASYTAAASGFAQYTVDSYGIIGSEITLDVALDANSNPVPYIGYYATSCVRPKYAKLVDGSDLGDGVDSDKFTGKWEVSLVPTKSTVPQDHVNVAAWKNSAGTISAPTTTYASNTYKYMSKSDGVISYASSASTTVTGYPSAYYDFKNNGSTYNAGSCGQNFGNGSSNPIVAYRNKVKTNGSVETAQMR